MLIKHFLAPLFMLCVVMWPASPVAAQTNDAAPSSLATLLETLKDDASRDALIKELENALNDAPPAAEADATDVPKQEISLGRQIAELTQSTIEDTVSSATAIWTRLTASENVFSGLRGDELAILWQALIGLFLVIAITIAVYLVLRYLAIPLYRRMGKRAENSNAVQAGLLFIASNGFDAIIVIVAWSLGYAVTVLALGEFGTIGIRQTMYLNAFLIVELAKVVVRSLLSPNAPGLRIVPLSDRAAGSLSRTLSIIISILGYGQLLVVPIVNQSASFMAGNGVAALLYVIVLALLIFTVLRHRRAVAAWMTDIFDPDTGLPEQSDTGQPAPVRKRRRTQSILIALAQNWHWFALAYLAVMFIVVMTQANETVFGALLGTAKILTALVVASLISNLLAKALIRGVTLPQDVNQKLPLLEPRLNTFARRAFRFMRLAILTVTAFFILDIVGFIDIRSWLESQIGLALTASLVSVGFILLASFVIWLAMTSWVDYRLNPIYGSVPTAREVTLLSLLRNAATIALVILTLMFCLSEIGLDIGPLLASAGVLGLAIGFGAQKMVQDIITGVFIQFENAINVGDVITVGGTTGVVEKLSVRSVSLRDAHGVFHIIPFSSVDMVSNFSRDFSYFVCDMGVAYRESIEEVKDAMLVCFDQLRKDAEQGSFVIDELEWFGIDAFADSAVVVRARIKTQPGKQWGVGRAYNGLLKTEFDARNIEIPFPHQTIYFGEAKDGSTQTVQIRSEEEGKA